MKVSSNAFLRNPEAGLCLLWTPEGSLLLVERAYRLPLFLTHPSQPPKFGLQPPSLQKEPQTSPWPNAIDSFPFTALLLTTPSWKCFPPWAPVTQILLAFLPFLWLPLSDSTSLKLVVSRAGLISLPYLIWSRCGFVPVWDLAPAPMHWRQELGSHTTQPPPSPIIQSAHHLTVATFIIPGLVKGFRSSHQDNSKSPQLLPTGAPLTISPEIGDHVTSLIKIPHSLPFP